MGHRTFLGTGVFTSDNGRTVDPLRLRGILHETHALRGRADEYRYSMKNPRFVQFVERTVEEGPPMAPILMRKRGLLGPKDEEYKYLKRAYGAKVAAEEPILETVFGNVRLYSLLEAMKLWDKNPEVKDRVMGDAQPRLIAMYQSLTDDEAEGAFVDENANRTRTSVYEDQLTIRARLKRGQQWDEIAERLRTPVKELRRIHEPLGDASLAVVLAFSEGSISRAELMRITKLDIMKQAEALEKPQVLPKAPPRKVKVFLDDIPQVDIFEMATHCANGGVAMSKKAERVSAWLKTLKSAGGGAQ